MLPSLDLYEFFDAGTASAIEHTAAFALPVLIVVFASLFIWISQTNITLYFYRNFIHKAVRKDKVAYWLVGWASVASHELLGHLLVGAFTGSKIEGFKVAADTGHVRQKVEVSAFGWLSLALSSLAPCFSPPLALIGIFYLLFPDAVVTEFDSLPLIAMSVISTFFAIIAYTANLFNPAALAFAYLLAVIAPTAGSSSKDIQNILVQAATKPFTLFVLMLMLTAVFFTLQFLGMPVVNPLLWLLALSFLVVMLGLAIALAITYFLSRTSGNPLIRVTALACFAVPYAAARLALTPELAELSKPWQALLLAIAVGFLATEVLTLFKTKKRKR